MIFCCWVIILTVLFAFPIYCLFDTWPVEWLPSHGCEGESWDGDQPPQADLDMDVSALLLAHRCPEVRINVLPG